MDTNMYERQHGGDLEVGSYAHRPILMEADAIPSISESALSPTELPFTKEDFDLQMEQGLARAVAGRQPDRGRDARGPGSLGDSGDQNQGGLRPRPQDRRVDDRRRPGDR